MYELDCQYRGKYQQRILGEDYVKRLSPVGNVYFRYELDCQYGGKKRYFITGIACLDFLDVYKRFCLKLRESYKLDAIGGVELGETKVDYEGMSLAELSEKDWNKFIDYNIQDVNLLVKLEQKLQYIPLLRMSKHNPSFG